MCCVETVVCSRRTIWCATTIAGDDTVLQTRNDVEQTPQLILINARTTNDIQLEFISAAGSIISTPTTARIHRRTHECTIFIGQWTGAATGVAQSTASIARTKWIRHVAVIVAAATIWWRIIWRSRTGFWFSENCTEFPATIFECHRCVGKSEENQIDYFAKNQAHSTSKLTWSIWHKRIPCIRASLCPGSLWWHRFPRISQIPRAAHLLTVPSAQWQTIAHISLARYQIVPNPGFGCRNQSYHLDAKLTVRHSGRVTKVNYLEATSTFSGRAPLGTPRHLPFISSSAWAASDVLLYFM